MFKGFLGRFCLNYFQECQFQTLVSPNLAPWLKHKQQRIDHTFKTWHSHNFIQKTMFWITLAVKMHKSNVSFYTILVMKLHVHGHWIRTMPPVLARQLYRSNLNWHTCVRVLTTLVRNVSLSRVFFELLACFSHVSSKYSQIHVWPWNANIDIVSEFVIYGCMSACPHDLVSKMWKPTPLWFSRHFPIDATQTT